MTAEETSTLSTPCTLNAIISATIRSMRQHKGMSQEELAEKAGLDRTHISLLERGKRSMTISTLELLIPHLTDDAVTFFDRLNDTIVSTCSSKYDLGKCPLLSPATKCNLAAEHAGHDNVLNKVYDLSGILDFVDSFLCLMKLDGTVICLNSKLCDFAGLSQHGVRGKTAWSLIPSIEEAQRVQKKIQEIACGQVLPPTDYEMQCVGTSTESKKIHWLVSNFDSSHQGEPFLVANGLLK